LKKAEGVTNTNDLTEREKAQQVEKLMRKGLAKGRKKKEVKVVVAKGVHRGLKGRPKGVKGRYVMVDSRMKKEVRYGHSLDGAASHASFCRFARRRRERKRKRNASVTRLTLLNRRLQYRVFRFAGIRYRKINSRIS